LSRPLLMDINYTVFLRDEKLIIIDRRGFPRKVEELLCSDCEQVAQAIENMAVQGAGDIAIAAAYGLYLAAKELESKCSYRIQAKQCLQEPYQRLVNTRPTGHYLKSLLDKIMNSLDDRLSPADQILLIIRQAIQKQQRRSELTGEWAKHADQKEKWTTVSDLEIKRLYGPEDIKDMDFEKDIGYPGQYPYLRGNQVTGYRGKYWTFRMFSGMGSAEETNQRWHYLLQSGQTGLSTAFDFPTLMGYDTDSPKARGECGKCGVAIDTIEDFFTLIKGIPLGEITTSMTINPPATVLWAMYCAAAEMQGIPLTKIGGTIQNDMLKEFIAQKTLMCPPEPSVKLISDTVEFGTKYVPRWNTISISGYHIREAGSTAVQELAFTLRDGMEYVEDVLERKGLHVDQFAPRLSFFFNAHIDFFEEIAKLRAARRIWAKAMRERYGSQDERSWRCNRIKMHVLISLFKNKWNPVSVNGVPIEKGIFK
jgi:hypothetical protein